MPDFTASIDIHLAADHAFDYIRDVTLLPSYTPFISHAEALGVGDRVRVIGEASGRRFESAGEWRVDRQAMRIEWTADSNLDYGGSLTVTRVGHDSRVDALLSFRVWSQEQLKHHSEREWEKIIQSELDGVLHKLKRVLERRGPAVMPPTSTRAMP